LALVASGLLSSCNFFNPDATGSYPTDDADALVDQGQRALQDERFSEAYADFARALQLDSTKSLAYHGLAKAEMGKDSFSIAQVVDLALSLKGVGSDSLLVKLVDWTDSLGYGWDTSYSRTDSTSRMSHLYRPLLRVASIYNRLYTRDSSGHLDGVFPSRLVDTERVTIKAYSKYFTLIDANADTVITKNELSTLRLLSSMSTGSVNINLDSLGSKMDSATGDLDSTTTSTINAILSNAASISSDTALLNKIASVSGASSSGLDSTTSSYISQLGTATNFYLINDDLDNDGDGCVNEEIFGDSVDNDGDSLVEEDGRVGLVQGTPVDGALALVTSDDGLVNDRLRIDASTGALETVSGTDDATSSLIWSGTTGLLKPYANLRWVRWDDATVGNDTIFARVVKEYNSSNGTSYTASYVNGTLGTTDPDVYKTIRTKAIIAVRQKVLAIPLTSGAAHVALGRKIVGGCWDNVK
jgi:hypothetical protein